MKKSNKENKTCICCEKLKPYKKEIIIAAIAFVCGFLIRLWTASPATVCNAALVDVQQLVNNSAEVQTIREDLAVKQQEAQKWIQESQAKIQKYKEGKAKNELVAKFEEELAQKQQALQQEYAEKLNAVDEKITKIIQKEAKADGYSMVLAKNAVLTGGTDITDEIIKLIK